MRISQLPFSRVAALLLVLPFAMATPGAVNAQDTVTYAFPADYLGVWAGDLAIFNAGGQQQSVPMTLRILPVNDSTYTYTMIYGIDTVAGKRDYLLRKGSEGKHHWVIDEQDGILLDNFYYGGMLHGPFTVSGTLLYGTLERRAGDLYYGISAGPEKPFRESGTTVDNEDGTTTRYAVKSFQPRSYQRARLRRRE